MKIIDLLNRIANGENVRFRISGEGGIYHWNKGEYLIFENTGNEEQWYIDDKWLNKEVEIIEEDKKIEKYDTGLTNGRFTKDSIKSGMEDENMSLEEIVIEIAKELTTLKEKVFEIIDKINKE